MSNRCCLSPSVSVCFPCSLMQGHHFFYMFHKSGVTKTMTTITAGIMALFKPAHIGEGVADEGKT